MKKIIFLNVDKIIMTFLAMAIALPLIAADTGQINYQARLLDSYGRRVNGTVDLSFKIYDAVTAGNLLWSETQADVVVQDGVYSIILGSQTAISNSVFAQNNVYLELGINGETMSPRQQITASAYSLVARTVMGSNIYENQASGNVGIGTLTPAAKLDVSGTVQATGFKMPTGATANYVLASDANGVGTWQPYSVVVTEHDPVHLNWVQVVYTPAINSIWGAINTEATTRANADTALDTAVGFRVFRSGDIMTGPLTNSVGFFGNYFAGNGAGLTNIPDSGLVSTSYVKKAGDTMTGPLVISNSLTVVSTNADGTINRFSLNSAGITMTGPMVISNSLTVVFTNADGTITNRFSLDSAGVTMTAPTVISNRFTVVFTNAGGTITNMFILGSAGVTITAPTVISNSLTVVFTNADGTITNRFSLDSAGVTITAPTVISNSFAVAFTNADGTITNRFILDSAGITITAPTVISNSFTVVYTNADGTNSISMANLQRSVDAVVMKTGDGGPLAFSNLYYYRSDGLWIKANATNSVTAKGLLGLALGGSIANDGLLLNGSCTNAWGFATGSIIYMDTNAGALATSAPTGTNNIVRIVGYAISDSKIFFNPDRTYIEISGQ